MNREPGGCECRDCGEVFVGEEWQDQCAQCAVFAVGLRQWLEDRRDNCIHLAGQKQGADKAGWLLDAAYFEVTLNLLDSDPAISAWAAAKPSAIVRNFAPPTVQ